MSKIKLLWRRFTGPGLLVLILLTFLSGYQFGKVSQLNLKVIPPKVTFLNKEPPKETKIDFQLFWDTWDLVSQNYFDKTALDPQKMFYGAIAGMVASIGDPYTYFLPPDQQKVSKEELGGSFDGVGIQLGFNKDKRLVVVAPVSGTPADKAGIKPEDVIVKIDNKDTTNLSLGEAVKLIRGVRGTKVTLTIFREGESDTRDFTLIRDTIIVKSVEVKYETAKSNKKIAIVKLSRFGERTNEEWTEAISDLLSSGATALVLDLRNNPGGYLDGAVYIASEFLTEGTVVMRENAKGERFSYTVNRGAKVPKLVMVVLINKGSASASEIVAGALQDRGRAKLVGESSFGKGTIQEAKDLPGGVGIHITIEKWLTPSGRWVNELGGLKPDFEVKIDPKETDSEKDIQLEKALELLN